MRALTACCLALLLALSPAQAALVVRPGPTPVPGSAPAALPPAASVAAWMASFDSFLRSPAPVLADVAGPASALADFDPAEPRAAALLAPLAKALEARLPDLLAAPSPAASESELAAAQLKLKVLNFPAVRALLPEARRDAVGAAAWAYNDVLWDRRGRNAGALAEAVAARLAEEPRPFQDVPAPAPAPGPDLTVEVRTGDVTQVPADALIATIDEAGLCRGGLHSAIDRASGCYRRAVESAPRLRDGRGLLVRPETAPGTAFKGVLFLSDERKRPLEEVVRDGLADADAAGLESVSLPVPRTGSAFGAVERGGGEVARALRRGVELFLAEARTALRRVSIVARNDAALAARVQAAFAPGRERSLRADLREARLSGRGYELAARPREVGDRSSPIYGSLLEPWSLRHLRDVHKPVPIGEIEDRAAFSGPTPSVLNMPIKMPGTGFRVPEELAGFREFLQKVIDHEAAVNPRMGDFYAYLTVDQNDVPAGSTHRRPGVHIDGVQGARYPVKLPPEHLYSASDRLGTVFYDQPFDLTRLDPAKHHVHAELERQADEARALRVPDYRIAFWDSYSVHRADVATEPMRRTFARVEFSRKKYDSLGDTHNPLFEYDWSPVARPIPADLDDRALEEVPEEGFRPELSALGPRAPHTVKDLARYLEDNLGSRTVLEAGRARFLVAVGEGREALARARSLGWTVGAKVAKREGFHQVFEARDPKGRKGFVIQRVNGEDRVLHVQSLLKLSGARGAWVTTVGRTKSWRARYREVFAQVGHKPDLVVYGFANTAIDAALLRNAFKNGRHFLTLARNYAAKRAAIAGKAEDAHDLGGMSMQVLELADGRKVWFLHCLFGDLARDLVGAAADVGAKNIAFIGSAGSLERSARVGEIVVPEALLRPDGTREALLLPEIPGLPRRGTYERIATPNLGTRAWNAAARRRGVDLVESELGHVLDELKDRPEVRLTVALVLAEAVYGPDGRDMTEWGLSDLRRLIPSLNKVLDAALGARAEDYVVRSYRAVPLDK